MRQPSIAAAAALTMTLLFCLSGCQSGGTAAPTQEAPDDSGDSCWVIQIDQTITAPYLGELGGQDTILSENTLQLVAVNDSDSPYDGMFTGTAYLTSEMDAKEQFNVANVDYLNLNNRHEAHDFTFALSKTNVVPLPLESDPDQRILFDSTSHFLMPTTGENPASATGSAEGYSFSTASDLDFSVTCDLEQSYQNITLETDMFGTFEGTLTWTDEVPELSAPEAEN